MAISGTPKRIVIDEIAPPGGYWPMRWAWLTGIFLPVTTIRRCDRGRMWLALATAAVALGLGLLAGLFLIAWVNAPYGSGLGGTLQQMGSWYAQWTGPAAPPAPFAGVQGVIHYPAQGRYQQPLWFMILARLVLVMGVFWFLSAVSLLPLAARPGGLRPTFRRALCRVGLLLPHAVALLVLLGALEAGLDKERAEVDRRIASLTVPVYPTTQANNSPAMADYRAQTRTYQAALTRIWDAKPWLVQYGPRLLALLRLLLMGWFLFVLWRALGHASWTPHSRWPAGCEGCGYPIIMKGHEGNCPECGRALTLSLDAADRPGLGWDAPGRHWWRRVPGVWWNAVRHPAALGRALRVYTPARRATAVGALVLVLAFALGFAGGAMLDRMNHPWRAPGWEGAEEWLVMCLITGLATAWVVLLSMWGLALVLALRLRVLWKGHYLAAAAQAGVCLGGWLLVWTVVVWASVGVMVAAMHGRWGRSWHNWGIPVEVMIGIEILAVAVCSVAIGWHLMYRIVRAARYANR